MNRNDCADPCGDDGHEDRLGVVIAIGRRGEGFDRLVSHQQLEYDYANISTSIIRVQVCRRLDLWDAGEEGDFESRRTSLLFADNSSWEEVSGWMMRECGTDRENAEILKYKKSIGCTNNESRSWKFVWVAVFPHSCFCVLET